MILAEQVVLFIDYLSQKGGKMMDDIYESFLEPLGKRAVEFLLFLWGTGVYRLPGSGNEPFGMQ